MYFGFPLRDCASAAIAAASLDPNSGVVNLLRLSKSVSPAMEVYCIAGSSIERTDVFLCPISSLSKMLNEYGRIGCRHRVCRRVCKRVYERVDKRVCDRICERM